MLRRTLPSPARRSPRSRPRPRTPAATTSSPAPPAAGTGATAPGPAARSTNYVVDTNCTPAGSLIGLRSTATRRSRTGRPPSLTFTSPIGTWITDFRVNRLLDFNSNPRARRARGRCTRSTRSAAPLRRRRRLRHRARATGCGSRAAGTATRRATPRSAGGRRRCASSGRWPRYRDGARTLSITVGCFRRTTNCSAPAGGRVFHVLYGVDVTVNDPAPPSPTVAAEGLLARGQRQGSDPVVVSATDNAGIRRVELWDVTGAAPVLVGARDATCTPRLAKPCPDLAKTPVVPTALRIGRRDVLVRTIDGAGNRPTAARSPSTSSRRRRAAASTAPARPRRRRSAPASRRAASASAPSATGARS